MTAHSSPQLAGAPLERTDKRSRILDAAEKVFARAGFFSAKVSDIAREAQVADGTIYLYFKNKDDLLISLFESRMERVNAELAAAVAPLPTAEAQLTALIATYLGLVERDPAVAEVLTIELRQSTKFMKEYANPRFGELLRLVASVVASGQERGEFEASAPAPVVARMIFGMLDELALAWLLTPSEQRKQDLGRTAEWAVAFVLHGLKRRKAS